MGLADYLLIWNLAKYDDTGPDGWHLMSRGNTPRSTRCAVLPGFPTPAGLLDLAEDHIQVYAPDAQVTAATVTVLYEMPGPYGAPHVELDVVELWVTETTMAGAVARAAAQLPIHTPADEFFRGARYRRHARDAARLSGGGVS